MLRPMSKWLIIFLLTACAGAQAMPGAPAEDDMSRFMADQGLLSKLEQVGTKLERVSHTVTDRASDLVVTAMGFLGVPYKRGGNTAETGFDCSGFVRAIYEKTVGLVLPRRANEQAAATEAIDKKDLRPGDLVFFNTMKRAFSHVGIYVGEGKFIHSPKPGAQVRVEDMGQNYWQRRFDGARRVLSQAPADSQAGRQP
jgi:cell wall-associated NlpC family hydrolase